MDKFIKLPKKEREIFFTEASRRHGMLSARILEKDFWVCFSLKQLFGIQELSKHLTFKGGTSLSKVYGLIERFSEDIDLTIDKEYLGIDSSKIYSQEENSRKKRQDWRKMLDIACVQAIDERILPLLVKEFTTTLGKKHKDSWNLEISPNDPLTILFQYPISLEQNLGNDSASTFGYIKPIVRLEFGARGDIFPTSLHEVTTYVADILPEVFDKPSDTSAVDVNVLDVERTFWEKVTILHELHYNEQRKPFKQAIARHYYDTFILTKKGVADIAAKKSELLKAVVTNSRLNCTDSNDSLTYQAFDDLLRRKIRLVPADWTIEHLKKDYLNMKESGMFFSEAPKFEEIIEGLRELEDRLNVKL